MLPENIDSIDNTRWIICLNQYISTIWHKELPETQDNELSIHNKFDGLRVVQLDQRPNDSQRRELQVIVEDMFDGGVDQRVEVKRKIRT